MAKRTIKEMTHRKKLNSEVETPTAVKRKSTQPGYMACYDRVDGKKIVTWYLRQKFYSGTLSTEIEHTSLESHATTWTDLKALEKIVEKHPNYEIREV